MNGLQMPLAVGLAAIAAGAVAYVVLTPLLSGESRAAKRRQAVSVVTAPAQRVATASRREQVARSLKEVEAKRGGTKVSLELKIARAGLDWTKQKFYAVSALMAVVTGLVVFVLTANTLATLAGLFAGAFGLPLWLLSFLRKKRIKAFITELPTAIDIITRGVRSGIPVGDCFRIIAREAQEPIRGEFRQVVESQTMGLTLGDAMVRMYERVPVSDVNFFAIVIGIQGRSGGNLSEALGNLSRVLRERKKMEGKIQAMSMEAKASGGIIAALPFVVAVLTYLSSPDYVALLWTTNTGKMALVASAIWMSIGIFVMKKMISFEV
ncbi:MULTISPECIES: type II secretion system F family protein [unclassified Methylobacterium]|uniref:type II secretion system F family protein n=1 Tax=unclassified Methylobacterium TaxID=2615210 RepID=UPI0006FD38A4|nr:MULTISPECIES: type II secretion system F family protein [unclassified Methylobacterium]KQO59867.1 pilus assembly protein [Methylobacterium sp. Leaf86]KQO85820.1 pilus assembly protein [Methylobacterium sp. Leaf91]